MPGPDLLTEAELACLETTGKLANQLGGVIGQGPSAPGDLAEAVAHLHAIQRAVMAQAAARAYPERFRLLGGPSPGEV